MSWELPQVETKQNPKPTPSPSGGSRPSIYTPSMPPNPSLGKDSCYLATQFPRPSECYTTSHRNPNCLGPVLHTVTREHKPGNHTTPKRGPRALEGSVPHATGDCRFPSRSGQSLGLTSVGDRKILRLGHRIRSRIGAPQGFVISHWSTTEGWLTCGKEGRNLSLACEIC
jgi:hypothetical protein